MFVRFLHEVLHGSHYLLTPQALFCQGFYQDFFSSFFFAVLDSFSSPHWNISADHAVSFSAVLSSLHLHWNTRAKPYKHSRAPSFRKPAGDTKHQEHSTSGTLVGLLESETLKVPLVSQAICSVTASQKSFCTCCCQTLGIPLLKPPSPVLCWAVFSRCIANALFCIHCWHARDLK